MSIITQTLMAFLNKAHSPYHVVAELKAVLKQAGYTHLQEKDAWGLIPGGKYYVTRGSSSIIAFRIPKSLPTGFMMCAGHDDFPGFALKDNLELTGRYTRMDTEGYGGMLMFPWLDRPLSVAGRVLVQSENGVEERLVDIDRDLVLIPNVAIHMNRNINDGNKWNPAVDTLPLMGGAGAQGKLKQLLEETAGGAILGHDLRLYVRQPASLWGLEEEYISGQGLDDLTCVWCSVQGFLEAEEGESIPVVCVFDNEEVGSATYQGAGADFLESVLERICRIRGLDKNRMLAQSFMISADNGHAVHPNHPEYADPGNAPVVNGGIALKFHASRKYTTDGLSAAILRKVCADAGVPVQSYYNRADMKGGSTLGSVSICHVAVPSVDVGIAQLAMHSCYETAGVADVEYLYRMFQSYYARALEIAKEGSYILK